MAQTGYTPIQLYYSTTASAVPTNTNLANGELAINITDGKLYYKDNTGTVKLLAGAGGAGIAGGSNTQVQYNSSGNLAGDADLTFDGTTLSTAGLTASGTVTLSGGTANGVTYLNGSKVLTSGSALTFDGSEFGFTRATAPFFRSTESNTGIVSYFGSYNVGLYLGTTSNHPIQFIVNSSEQMRLTSTGLGIGTSSPAFKLDLNGVGAVRAGQAIRYYRSDNAIYTELYDAGASGGFTTNNANGDGFRWQNGSSTTVLTLNSSGNLGLGVTPSAWGSTYTALQVKNFGLMAKDDSNWLYSNAYFNGTSNLYTGNGYAGIFDFNGHVTGGYVLRIAPSGSAGGSASFTQVLAVEKDKSLALQGASSASGTGITFPATQSASSDANTLDDYEEGTWNPNQGSGLTVIGAFTSSGTYTKIGRQVTFSGRINAATSVAVSSSGIISTNFPFSSAVIFTGGIMNDTATVSGGIYINAGTIVATTTISATPALYFSATFSV